MSVVRTLSTRYQIGPDKRIRWTSPNWDRFAHENGASELADGRVLERPLWEFIEGDAARRLYEDVIDHVLESGEVASIPFRCDSPDVRRFMTLRIERTSTSMIELAAEMLRAESRAPVALLSSECPRSGEAIDLCSFCKRVETPDARWLEVEEASRILGLEAREECPPLHHVVCDDCEKAASIVWGDP